MNIFVTSTVITFVILILRLLLIITCIYNWRFRFIINLFFASKKLKTLKHTNQYMRRNVETFLFYVEGNILDFKYSFNSNRTVMIFIIRSLFKVFSSRFFTNIYTVMSLFKSFTSLISNYDDVGWFAKV